MLITLPKDLVARKRALDWLVRDGMRHMRLSEVVDVPGADDARRFQAWLDRSGSGAA